MVFLISWLYHLNVLPYIPLANTSCLWVCDPKNTKLHISILYTQNSRSQSQRTAALAAMCLPACFAPRISCGEGHGTSLIWTARLVQHTETQHWQTEQEHEWEERGNHLVCMLKHTVEWKELTERTVCVGCLCLSLPNASPPVCAYCFLCRQYMNNCKSCIESVRWNSRRQAETELRI